MELVRHLTALPADLDRLGPAAAAEGIETIRRVRAEWDAGLMRFDQPGEALLSVRKDGRLIGIGGLTRDVTFADALRMRRFYVLPEFRGHGAGRLMAEWLLRHASSHANRVTVHAGSDDAARFWERLGFTPAASDTHSHELRF